MGQLIWFVTFYSEVTRKSAQRMHESQHDNHQIVPNCSRQAGNVVVTHCTIA